MAVTTEIKSSTYLKIKEKAEQLPINAPTATDAFKYQCFIGKMVGTEEEWQCLTGNPQATLPIAPTKPTMSDSQSLSQLKATHAWKALDYEVANYCWGVPMYPPRDAGSHPSQVPSYAYRHRELWLPIPASLTANYTPAMAYKHILDQVMDPKQA